MAAGRSIPPSELDYVPEHGAGKGLESLFHHVQVYYRAKQQAAAEDVAVIHQHESKEFWTLLKSAIFFYKDGGDERALSNLQKIGNQIPAICSAQALSLLRELLTTLSRANTNILEGLRDLLLRTFARQFHKPGHLEHHLYIVCSLLRQHWVTDYIHVTMLYVLMRIMDDHPDPLAREIVELHRSQLQILRRMGDLVAADSCATESRATVEARHGPNSESTRLIMPEQVHILSAQRKPEEALKVAEDIVQRAELWDGAAFPTQRSIYHLEDVAEILRRLGRFEEAVELLDSTFKHAKRNQAHPENTLHLQDKLEALRVGLEQTHLH